MRTGFVGEKMPNDRTSLSGNRPFPCPSLLLLSDYDDNDDGDDDDDDDDDDVSFCCFGNNESNAWRNRRNCF